MARFLANENAPREAVLAARGAGFDVAWMVELQPGASDEIVLWLAQREDRVLITFDKDFDELVFRRGRAGSPGIILLRPRLRSRSLRLPGWRCSDAGGGKSRRLQETKSVGSL